MAARALVLSLLLVLVAGCASSSQGPRPRNSRDVLTRAELEASMQPNALDAIRQARPSWLRVRGPNSFYSQNPIMVYVDGVRAGALDALQGIPVLSVERMRFYDPTEAQARFGLNHTNGAIEVITRKGS